MWTLCGLDVAALAVLASTLASQQDGACPQRAPTLAEAPAACIQLAQFCGGVCKGTSSS